MTTEVITEEQTDLDRGLSLNREVPYSQDPRTEDEIRRGTILFENHGFLSVRINAEAISQLLRDVGLHPSVISQIRLRFQAAHLAQKDAKGESIMGWAYYEGRCIEIYTTIQTNANRFRLTETPVIQDEIVRSVLHELRHIIQNEQGNQMRNTFEMTAGDHDADPNEIDAMKFASDHLPDAKNWLTRGDFSSSIEPASIAPDVDPYFLQFGQVLDLDKSFGLTDSDPKALYWEEEGEEIKKLFSSNLSPRQIEEAEIRQRQWLQKGRDLIEKGKLGLYEYRIVEKSLANR